MPRDAAGKKAHGAAWRVWGWGVSFFAPFPAWGLRFWRVMQLLGGYAPCTEVWPER